MRPKRDNELIDKLQKQLEDESISEEMKNNIKELIKQYEYVTFKEWNDKQDFYADAVSDMVNDFAFDEEHLAKAMAKDHNTNQQNFMRLCKAFILQMAKKEYFDGRNKASVELAKSISEKLEKTPLPYV